MEIVCLFFQSSYPTRCGYHLPRHVSLSISHVSKSLYSWRLDDHATLEGSFAIQ